MTPNPGSSWLRPMVARRADEAHRASTPLELLFDLCFVVVVLVVTGALQARLGPGRRPGWWGALIAVAGLVALALVARGIGLPAAVVAMGVVVAGLIVVDTVDSSRPAAGRSPRPDHAAAGGAPPDDAHGPAGPQPAAGA